MISSSGEGINFQPVFQGREMGTVCLSRKSRGASSQVRAQGVCRVEKHQWGWSPGGGPGTLSKASGSQEGSGVKEGGGRMCKGGDPLGVLGGRKEWQQQ